MSEIAEIEKIVCMMRLNRVVSLKTPKFEIVLDGTAFSAPFDEPKDMPIDDDSTLFWSAGDSGASGGKTINV